MKIQLGQIWSVALGPVVANEQAGVRPCIVISADRFNALPIRHGIVVPLTSRDRGLPHHVPVIDNGALSRPSWAMCEAVRAVSIRRFSRMIGTVSPETTRHVTRQVALWFDQR